MAWGAYPLHWREGKASASKAVIGVRIAGEGDPELGDVGEDEGHHPPKPGLGVRVRLACLIRQRCKCAGCKSHLYGFRLQAFKLEVNEVGGSP